MPWKECCKVDERLRFVARLLNGEKMAALCREFDISRKTGYKIFNRYKDCALDGLTDRSGRELSEPVAHRSTADSRNHRVCIMGIHSQFAGPHPECRTAEADAYGLELATGGSRTGRCVSWGNGLLAHRV